MIEILSFFYKLEVLYVLYLKKINSQRKIYILEKKKKKKPTTYISLFMDVGVFKQLRILCYLKFIAFSGQIQTTEPS